MVFYIFYVDINLHFNNLKQCSHLHSPGGSFYKIRCPMERVIDDVHDVAVHVDDGLDVELVKMVTAADDEYAE